MKHPVQGDLFASSAGASAESLRRFLSEAGNCRVDLTLTRNRVTMASVSFVTEGHARVRLHAQFITAPQEVFDLLRERARPYLFSNSLAHSIVMATLRALELLEDGD